MEDAAGWLVKRQRLHGKEWKGRRCAALLFVRSVMPFVAGGDGEGRGEGRKRGRGGGREEERKGGK